MTFTRFRRDQRGASPWIIVASLAVFLVAGTGIAFAVTSGLEGNATVKMNAALAEAVTAQAKDVAATGYEQMTRESASTTVTLTVAEKKVTAIQTIQVNATFHTAQVTVAAGRYADFEFIPSTKCAATPKLCAIASETVAGLRGK